MRKSRPCQRCGARHDGWRELGMHWTAEHPEQAEQIRKWLREQDEVVKGCQRVVAVQEGRMEESPLAWAQRKERKQKWEELGQGGAASWNEPGEQGQES